MHEQSRAVVDVGDLLARKYRVDRVLGSGGMGVVVAATHVDLGQRVAVKFLLPHALAHPEAAARFTREARAAAKIDSEHVARVLDVGRLENGAPYLVMEYLEGHDLSALPKGTGIAIEDAVDYVLQACEAMAVAHTLGIVHRDLKPANLFLTHRPDGSPIIKVLDFGVSKLTDLEQAGVELTQGSAMLGSPLYMSPEHMKSARDVDSRTDIWALGAILYELIAGGAAFPGDSLPAVFDAVLNGEPVPLRRRRPDVPERLAQVISKALAKDPRQRFADVAELARALREFAPRRSLPVVERVLGVVSLAAGSTLPSALGTTHLQPAPTGATALSFERDALRRAKSQWMSIGIGFAIVAVLTSAVVARLRSPATAVPAAPSTRVVDAARPTTVLVEAPPAPVQRATTAPNAEHGSVVVAPVESARPPVKSAISSSGKRPLRGGAPVSLANGPRPPAKTPADSYENPLRIDFK